MLLGLAARNPQLERQNTVLSSTSAHVPLVKTHAGQVRMHLVAFREHLHNLRGAATRAHGTGLQHARSIELQRMLLSSALNTTNQASRTIAIAVDSKLQGN